MTITLNQFMSNAVPEILEIVRRFPTANIQIKEDGTPVTDLDLFLSSYIEDLVKKKFPDVIFYSEEKYSDWKFPMITLDPLDGTREYIEGRDEWSISIALFKSEKFEGEGWVFNPKRDEIFELPGQLNFTPKKSYCGEVSRSEWKKGLFKNNQNHKFQVTPVGSIAYKLGRLAYNKSDFVISLTPKNIWDIAGGTLLCLKAGFKFYSNGKEVTSVEKMYSPPLIWCHESLFSEISKIYF